MSVRKKTYKEQLKKVVGQTNTKKEFFEPTIEDCKKWYRILNQEIFNNTLPPTFDTFVIKRLRGAWAWFVWEKKGLSIEVNHRFMSKKQFVEVIAHELIHLHQYCNNDPFGHGPSFEIWQDKFNKKGLALGKIYNYE